MGLGHSPKIVTNGLMMYMDAANTKSYRNYNLANYSQDFTNAVYTKSTGLVSATGLLAPDGTLTATTLTDDVNGVYESFSRGFTVANDSASYNIAMYIRKTTGGTSSRTGFNVSFTTGGTTKSYNIRFNADTGVATGGDTNLVTSENNNFWRLSFTVSNNATGNTVLNISYYPATGFYNGADDATATGSHTVWGLQVTRGATLLSYKTNVDDSANICYDLSGNLTTFNNGNYSFPSYNSGYFTFVNNGVIINHIKAASNILNTSTNTNYTRIGWFYQTSQSTGWGPIIQNQIGNNTDMGLVTKSNKLTFYQYTNTATSGTTSQDYFVQSTGTFSDNVWVMGAITVNRASQLVKFYINGNYDSQSAINIIGNSSSDTIIIGGADTDAYTGTRMFKGRIGIASHYNRILSDLEILQNFNAFRGRFGL
jgi:hypothetical protein